MTIIQKAISQLAQLSRLLDDLDETTYLLVNSKCSKKQQEMLIAEYRVVKEKMWSIGVNMYPLLPEAAESEVL